MVCTKCGAQLKDTDLFCLNCGNEVQIVPDYNPVEEMVVQNLALAQQNEVMSKDTEETIENTNKETANEDTPKEKPSPVHKKRIKSKKPIIFPVFLIAAVVIVISVVSLWNNHKKSFAYQYQLAQESMEEKNYEEVFEHLSKALAVKEKDINARFLLAQAYIETNKQEQAITCLQEVLKIDTQNEEAVKQLIEIYSDYDYTDELTEFVTQLQGTKLAGELGEFYLNRPSFSIDGGSYDKYISVEITSKKAGDIYYTVDGTRPTIQAIKYSGQIRLRGGTTKIRAVTINESGEASVESIQEYTVHSTVPDNPIINPASGNYTLPSQINIIVPKNCKVYYTLDGSIPTERSYLYQNPLDMPLGEHTLSVIAMDENGIESNMIQSNYNLQIEATFTIEQAHTILMQRLGNELVDEKGAFALECTSAIEIGGYTLYAFEKIYGASGNKVCASEKYVFDVLTAETFYAVRNGAGGYDLAPF